MLGDHTSIYFQTELRFLPIDEFRFGKKFVRDLYSKLAEPGGYAYEDLSIQEGMPSMSTKRVMQGGAGESVCKVGPDTIVIEETIPQINVDGYIESVDTIMKAVAKVNDHCPPIFGQRCVIRCLAKPLNSEHSIRLLAGKVSNVLNAIAPFERPPQYFGIRFRFPPVRVVDDSEENGLKEEERRNFISVRFETWWKDVEQVWMEVNAMYFFQEAVEVSDTNKMGHNIKDAYEFLTEKCVDFLNHFDEKPNPPDDEEKDEEEEK